MDATLGMSLAILFHHVATGFAARWNLQVITRTVGMAIQT
jgi:hypothetical protein